jgi:hypothetical protein
MTEPSITEPDQIRESEYKERTMDTTTIIVIVAVIALLAFYLYNRRKPAPRGTYDDKDMRSSGSIGGGPRAHDDANLRSSGSIGGGTRSYDSPEHTSGGSIGGRQRTENQTNRAAVQPMPRRPMGETDRDSFTADEDRDNLLPPLTNGIQSETDVRVNRQPNHNQPDNQEENDKHRSSGSFGGSRR